MCECVCVCLISGSSAFSKTCLNIRKFTVHTKSFEGYRGERFMTLEEALNMKDLDAALIEVPNLDLVPVGMMFAERGIPIHLDKPCGDPRPMRGF